MSERITVAQVDRNLENYQQRTDERLSKLESSHNELKLQMVTELTKISERQNNMNNAMTTIQNSVERTNIKFDELDRRENSNKAKWYDEVVKYVMLVILGYIAFKLGLK